MCYFVSNGHWGCKTTIPNDWTTDWTTHAFPAGKTLKNRRYDVFLATNREAFWSFWKQLFPVVWRFLSKNKFSPPAPKSFLWKDGEFRISLVLSFEKNWNISLFCMTSSFCTLSRIVCYRIFVFLFLQFHSWLDKQR